MKPFIFLLISFFLTVSFIQTGNAQMDKTTRPSPPRESNGTYKDTQVTITYSSPFVKGRTIWGDLVPYGKVWRTGANEATIFETDKDLILQDQILPAGKYALFTIPGEKEWIWIFNAEWEQWGAYKYDVSKDVLRIQSIPLPSPVYHEQLAFTIAGDRVSLYWENLSVSF